MHCRMERDWQPYQCDVCMVRTVSPSVGVCKCYARQFEGEGLLFSHLQMSIIATLNLKAFLIFPDRFEKSKRQRLFARGQRAC